MALSRRNPFLRYKRPRALLLLAVLSTATPACRTPAGSNRAARDEDKRKQPARTRAEPPSEPSGGPAAELLSRSRKLMGTLVTITVAGASAPGAETAITDAFKEVERLERLFSHHRPDSDISRINASAGSKPVQVAAETLEVIAAGLRISTWSEGAFDLTWAALGDLYRFDRKNRRFPTPEEVKQRLPLIGHRDVLIDETDRTVLLRRPGMRIGAGGIAKGYALDRAALILQRAGLANFTIRAGGQVTVRGNRDGRPWRVGIRHPRRADYFGQVEITSGSLATSGDYERAFTAQGKRWHHILDPRTGFPAMKSLSVTVLADSGLYSDAMSTALFVSGPAKALQLLQTAPENTGAVIVAPDLSLHTGGLLQGRLILKGPLQEGRLSDR